MYQINGRFWKNGGRYENSETRFRKPQWPPEKSPKRFGRNFYHHRNFYELWFSQNNWISHLMPHFLHSWDVFRLKYSNFITSDFMHNTCVFDSFARMHKNKFIIDIMLCGYDIGSIGLWKYSFHNGKNCSCIHQTM